MLDVPDVQPTPAWFDAWDSFELYLLSAQKSPGTIRNLRSLVLILARHATAAGLDPADVTKSWIHRYVVDQAADRRGRGAVTFGKYLSSFWKWYAAEYETTNPMAKVPVPRGAPEPVPDVLSPEQVRSILAACKTADPWESARNTALLSLLLESGLRRFELCALDVADVDVKAGTVLVHLGKGRKPRMAAFGYTAAADLQRWLRRRGSEPGPLYTTSAGRRLAPGTVNHILREVGQRAGVVLRPHMCRHTWAHAVKSGGMAESDIMTLGGWSSTVMLRRYGQAMAQERALASARQIQAGAILRGKAVTA